MIRFNGRILKGNLRVADYNIVAESVIQIMHKKPIMGLPQDECDSTKDDEVE